MSKEIILYAPNSGTIDKLENVEDEVFAQKMMGDGAAIDPKDSIFTSPCDGRIVSVFPTKHAVGIETKDGLELMLHVGLDTVELKGKGFKSFVKDNDTVKKGDRLLKVNLKKVQKEGKPLITPLVITNMDLVEDISFKEGKIAAGEPFITVTLKQ